MTKLYIFTTTVLCVLQALLGVEIIEETALSDCREQSVFLSKKSTFLGCPCRMNLQRTGRHSTCSPAPYLLIETNPKCRAPPSDVRHCREPLSTSTESCSRTAPLPQQRSLLCRSWSGVVAEYCTPKECVDALQLVSHTWRRAVLDIPQN